MYTSRGSLLALGALTSTLLLAACGSEPEVGNQAVKPVRTAAAPSKAMGLPVKAETVRVGAVIDEVTAVGSLLAEESVIIRPEIDGRIASLNFREGQSVKRGQRLLSLDSSEYEAQLAAVKAELRTEQQRHQRAKELHEQKFITKEALDVQAGAVDRLEARVKEAQVRVDKTVMRAPFSGIVGLREVSPGAYVKAGDDIVILENLDSIKVDFRIPEVYLAKVGREQLVTLRLDAFPDEEFEGRVYAVHPVVDEETRTVLLRARVENRGFRLKPGMFVRVALDMSTRPEAITVPEQTLWSQGIEGRVFAVQPVVDEETRTVLMRARVANKGFRLKPGMFARVALTMSTRPNAITVPEQALWPQGRDNFVYKVVDGKAMLTKVELGNRRPGEVEIKQGLVPGDVVVTEGQIKLRDGAPVMVMGAPPASGQSTAQDGGSQSG